MAARKRRGKASAQSGATSEDRVIDATLALAAAKGWHAVALTDVAEEVGLSLAGLYALFPSKGAILDAFMRRIDRATLSGAGAASGSVRDNLFELFMRRFDALAPHKQVVAGLVADAPRDPVAALCQGARLLRSISWIAAAAGVDTSGLFGALRVKALAAVYVYVLRVWLGEDSPDHSKTMAALDKALKRTEMLAQSMPAARSRARTKG